MYDQTNLIMKPFFLISVLLCLLNNSSFSQLSTDTIHRSIITQQGDSLIQANTGNPDFIILDMRTPSEYSGGHIQNAVNMNYYSATLSADLDALDKNKIYLLYCAGGTRSTATFNIMKSKLFRELYNMLGGISQWISLGYPVVTGTSGIDENTEEYTFEVFQNPSNSSLFINCNSASPDRIKLFDLVGHELMASFELITNGKYKLNLATYRAGVYIVSYIHSNGVLQSKQVVIY